MSFPSIELLRAEYQLFEPEKLTAGFFGEIERTVNGFYKTLPEFIKQRPHICINCTLQQLKQTYSGTCSEDLLINNFFQLNFTPTLKKELTETLFKYSVGLPRHLQSSELADQYVTQYIVYDNINTINVSKSYAALQLFALFLDVQNLHMTTVTLKKQNREGIFVELPKTPKSRSSPSEQQPREWPTVVKQKEELKIIDLGQQQQQINVGSEQQLKVTSQQVSRIIPAKPFVQEKSNPELYKSPQNKQQQVVQAMKNSYEQKQDKMQPKQILKHEGRYNSEIAPPAELDDDVLISQQEAVSSTAFQQQQKYFFEQQQDEMNDNVCQNCESLQQEILAMQKQLCAAENQHKVEILKLKNVSQKRDIETTQQITDMKINQYDAMSKQKEQLQGQVIKLQTENKELVNRIIYYENKFGIQQAKSFFQTQHQNSQNKPSLLQDFLNKIQCSYDTQSGVQGSPMGLKILSLDLNASQQNLSPTRNKQRLQELQNELQIDFFAPDVQSQILQKVSVYQPVIANLEQVALQYKSQILELEQKLLQVQQQHQNSQSATELRNLRQMYDRLASSYQQAQLINQQQSQALIQSQNLNLSQSVNQLQVSGIGGNQQELIDLKKQIFEAQDEMEMWHQRYLSVIDLDNENEQLDELQTKLQKLEKSKQQELTKVTQGYELKLAEQRNNYSEKCDKLEILRQKQALVIDKFWQQIQKYEEFFNHIQNSQGGALSKSQGNISQQVQDLQNRIKSPKQNNISADNVDELEYKVDENISNINDVIDAQNILIRNQEEQILNKDSRIRRLEGQLREQQYYNKIDFAPMISE